MGNSGSSSYTSSQKQDLKNRIHNLEYRSLEDARPYKMELDKLRDSYYKSYGEWCPYKPRPYM